MRIVCVWQDVFLHGFKAPGQWARGTYAFLEEETEGLLYDREIVQWSFLLSKTGRALALYTFFRIIFSVMC